ncbi:hypothetical protein F4679DRAFT_204254 [Xylaria curta]|nr:hypothetical protein F4679DRAFT_204254 [Xylaria curta]
MAPMGDPDKVDLFQRLEDLYKDGDLANDSHDFMDTKTANVMQGILSTPKGYDPSITIPNIINYLRDNDAGRDVDWDTNFTLIRGYLADAHRRMVTGSLGFGDPKLCAALEDARVMVRVHLHFEKRAQEKTPWTDSILRGQTLQERLLTYPKVFPLPESDRSKSQYQPIKRLPRPNDDSPLWNTTLKVTETSTQSILAEVDNYVDSENKFFQWAQESPQTREVDESTWKNNRFVVEDAAYEDYMSRGPAGTCADPPPPYNDGPTGSVGPKSPAFYRRRGWQRAALQQCLNLFTSHENRAINTPWRRPVLPYDPPPQLPREIAYVPRVDNSVSDEKEDPFSWLHWSSQHAKIVDFLAACQRRNYNQKSWDDFSAPALPKNFRGPQIYRGLTVHDQHWLKIGEYLENLESLIQSAWGAAPRPFLRAILRDIDAGRHENTGGPGMDKSHILPTEDDDGMLDRKRHWRRDIKRRTYIDNQSDNTNDDNYKLVDDFDIAWLRYLCEPSRTLEMCDPSKQPSKNLAIIFDAKLQSYFRNFEVSGYPDSKELSIWGESYDDIDDVKRKYKPSTLRAVVAYINGCTDSELIYSGEKDPNPEHPNACYQYSLEEAEFLCVDLSNLGRCVYIPEHGNEPARVGRPSYNVHPEDRVMWRYLELEEFHNSNKDYLDEMVDHYDASYGNWSSYLKNRPRFSRELEFMLDHTGPDFHYELERVETQDKHPGTKAAFGKRRAFIREYLAPEGLCRIGDSEPDSIENARAAPHRTDLAPWEAVGAYLKKYHEQHKGMHNHMRYYYPGDLQHPQTPERTAQFFRNLAYRAGRTLRYVDQIKDRLQYLENNTKPVTSKAPLDLSADLKEPRPENSGDAPVPTIVEKWWQAIPVKDHNSAIEKWNTSIKEGSGELTLLPPNINEVLERADPRTYRTLPKSSPIDGKQDPFTIIREGIIENCFQNRPTMYPGRLSGFKDQTKSEFQGYERPNLFEWATKDQRRYQAPHTRRDFFNMQRWPPSRILPHRREAIRARKDEVARKDPSKSDQAYGILTNRVPIGKEKPLYAHPLIHHHGNAPSEDWRSYMNPPSNKPPPDLYTKALGAKSKVKNKDDEEESDSDFSDVKDDSVNMAGVEPDLSHIYDKDLLDPGFFDDSGKGKTPDKKGAIPGKMSSTTPKVAPPKGLVTLPTPAKTPAKPTAPGPKGPKSAKGAKPATTRKTARATSKFIPYERSNQKFAPGPAIFPMGDTLLQKVLISHELNNALYPEQPFYKRRLLGLSNVWRKIITTEVPLVPLVPPTARSNIPRSNPRKRKMPIEFLNNSATPKKFRSDKTVPIMPGGNGGQFGAATAVEVEVETAGETDTESVAAPVYKNFQKTLLETGGKKKGVPAMTTPSKPATTIPAMPTWSANPKKPVMEAVGIKPTEQAIPAPSTAGLSVIADTDDPEGFVSLRIYPNPSRRKAKDAFERQFAGAKWTSSNVDYKYLFSAACRSLAMSINAQYAGTGLETTPEDLSNLARTEDLELLHPYMWTNDNNNFDIHCVAYLLQAFGEKHGAKIQLGVVQEDPNGTQQYPLWEDKTSSQKTFAAFLVGSKYNKDPDKIVVWIRLQFNTKYHRRLVNPYSHLAYNSYDSVSKADKADKGITPSASSQPENWEGWTF